MSALPLKLTTTSPPPSQSECVPTVGNTPVSCQPTLLSLPGRLISSGRTELCAHWLSELPRRDGYVAEVIVKEPDAIRRRLKTWTRIPTLEELMHDTLRYGRLSARPYHLAQIDDGSTLRCVLALFADFCRVAGLSPRAMARDLEPGIDDERLFSPDSCAELRRHAYWETVQCPWRWNPAAVWGLSESLYQIRWYRTASSLARVAEDAKHPQRRRKPIFDLVPNDHGILY